MGQGPIPAQLIFSAGELHEDTKNLNRTIASSWHTRIIQTRLGPAGLGEHHPHTDARLSPSQTVPALSLSVNFCDMQVWR